jgi:hypothetical protein
MNNAKPNGSLSNQENSAAHDNAVLDAQILALDASAGERMLESLFGFIRRFVSYPSEHAHLAHALWIIHAHMMARWDSTPRLAFLSAEPASGKTRALEVTELLVPNPVATVNVTPAYLFRKVGSEGGATILFDEIDTVFGPRAKDNEDIRGLLNAGHRRGATAGRCVMRGKELVTEELPAYAAVALAGIGWLPDTLLSRSIIIRMRRRHASEQVEGFRRRIHELEGWRIRDQISVWAKAAISKVEWPNLPTEIADRDADVWEPLIAISDAIGGPWANLGRQAAIALVTQSKDVEPSLGIKLLADMQLVFGDADEMSSKTIIQGLIAVQESPWGDLRGKPLDERGLAYRLKQYGVKPKTIRQGSSTPRGYLRSDLTDLWARYLPAGSATSATSKTFVPESNGAPSSVSAVADVLHLAALAPVCAHCQQAGGKFCEASVNGDTISLHLECKDAFRLPH